MTNASRNVRRRDSLTMLPSVRRSLEPDILGLKKQNAAAIFELAGFTLANGYGGKKSRNSNKRKKRGEKKFHFKELKAAAKK